MQTPSHTAVDKTPANAGTRTGAAFHKTSTPGSRTGSAIEGSEATTVGFRTAAESSWWRQLPERRPTSIATFAARSRRVRISPRESEVHDGRGSVDGKQRGTTAPMDRRGYQASLDNELIPRFGHRKLREVGYEDVLKWIRSLEARRLSSSTIDAHLLVMRGVSSTHRRLGTSVRTRLTSSTLKIAGRAGGTRNTSGATRKSRPCSRPRSTSPPSRKRGTTTRP